MLPALAVLASLESAVPPGARTMFVADVTEALEKRMTYSDLVLPPLSTPIATPWWLAEEPGSPPMGPVQMVDLHSELLLATGLVWQESAVPPGGRARSATALVFFSVSLASSSTSPTS